jgi:DNA sulfur modification protein DndE
MKRIISSVLILASIFSAAQEKSINDYIAEAPFKMPAVMLPVFSSKTFSLADYGGVADGQTLNTTAFAKLIDACASAGGGKAIIPPGVWLTGPIDLKSNVDLHAERGAMILFTPDHTQYPMIHPSKGNSSFIVHPPIYGTDLQNVAITGEGIFDGSGETWRPLKKIKATEAQWKKFTASGGVVSKDGSVWWPSREAMEGEAYLKKLKDKKDAGAEDYFPARDFLRPKMVVFNNCDKVLLDGPTFKNSPNFVINPGRCTNLTIRNVQVNNEWWAQNGDGIDISACKGVVIYRCTVNAGDDGICMKSSGGKGPDQFELENILIADCTVYKAHGGFVIGSNTDGGMRNIYVTNCNFIGSDIGIRVKSNAGRGGLVQDIFINKIFMKDILNEAISFDTYYEDVPAGKEKDSVRTVLRDKTPLFRDFHISNLVCYGAHTAISITGLPEMPVQKIYFDNMTISADAGVQTDAAADIFLKNVKIIPASGPVYSLKNSSGIQISNGFFPSGSGAFLSAIENVSGVTISGTDLRNNSSAIQLGAGVEKKSVILNK